MIGARRNVTAYRCSVRRLVMCCVLIAASFQTLSAEERAPLGQGFGERQIEFQLDLAFHLGGLQSEVGSLDQSAFLGQFTIFQPLKKNEVQVDLAFVEYAVTVPAAPEFAQPLSLEQSTARAANPTLMYYFPSRNLSQQTRFGVGLTAPIAGLRDDRIERSRADAYAYEAASAMRGHRSPWQWMPKTFALIGHLDHVSRWATGLSLGLSAQTAPVFAISTTKGNGFSGITSTPEPVDILLQGKMSGAYDTGSVKVSIGANYLTSTLKDLPQPDRDQFAGSGEARIRFGGLDLVIAVFMPLDGPGGYAFDADKLWSVQFGFATASKYARP